MPMWWWCWKCGSLSSDAGNERRKLGGDGGSREKVIMVVLEKMVVLFL